MVTIVNPVSTLNANLFSHNSTNLVDAVVFAANPDSTLISSVQDFENPAIVNYAIEAVEQIPNGGASFLKFRASKEGGFTSYVQVILRKNGNIIANSGNIKLTTTWKDYSFQASVALFDSMGLTCEVIAPQGSYKTRVSSLYVAIGTP